MLDNPFFFSDLNANDMTDIVIEADLFFDFLRKTGLDKKVPILEGQKKIAVPLDVALSLLTPDELEKLKNYIAFYTAKYPEE